MVYALTELLVDRMPYQGLFDFLEMEVAKVRAESAVSTSAAGQQNGTEVARMPLELLMTRPHAGFQVGSGRKYYANEDGMIACDDPEDRVDLLHSGCREQPSAD